MIFSISVRWLPEMPCAWPRHGAERKQETGGEGVAEQMMHGMIPLRFFYCAQDWAA